MKSKTNVKRGLPCKIVRLLPDATHKGMPDVFVNSRRIGKVGTVDSAIYDNLNRHWLVKHDTSCLAHGISIGYYGIYHEDEIQIINPSE